MTQVSFERVPGMSKLFLDYTSNWTKVQRFYQHPYSLDSILGFGRRRQQQGLPHREALCRALAEQQVGWGGNSNSVDRLASGAVAIVTGQQPGLSAGRILSSRQQQRRRQRTR